MKVEIDDNELDRVVEDQIKVWIKYYERELELVKLQIEDKIDQHDRVSVFWSDPKKDKKEIKRRLKAWRVALEDYSFLSKWL